MLTIIFIAILIYATETVRATVVKVQRDAIPLGTNANGFYDSGAFMGLYNAIMGRGKL